MDPISDKLFKVIEAELPYREESGGYTKYGDWYGAHVDDSYSFKTAAWCDMFLAWAADQAGVAEYAGQFAYTPAHANWFRQQGAWSTTPEPGAFVFYNWSGSKSVGGISHVGIVEKVAGTKIHTIEGNADGVYLKRKVRDTGTVVGYGLPRLVKVDGATYEQTLAAAATPAATPPPAVAATPAASAPAPEPTAASAAPASPGSALSPMFLGAGEGAALQAAVLSRTPGAENLPPADAGTVVLAGVFLTALVTRRWQRRPGRHRAAGGSIDGMTSASPGRSGKVGRLRDAGRRRRT